MNLSISTCWTSPRSSTPSEEGRLSWVRIKMTNSQNCRIFFSRNNNWRWKRNWNSMKMCYSLFQTQSKAESKTLPANNSRNRRLRGKVWAVYLLKSTSSSSSTKKELTKTFHLQSFSSSSSKRDCPRTKPSVTRCSSWWTNRTRPPPMSSNSTARRSTTRT